MNKLSLTIIDVDTSLEVALDKESETAVLMMAPLRADDDKRGLGLELDVADAAALGALLTAFSRRHRSRSDA